MITLRSCVYELRNFYSKELLDVFVWLPHGQRFAVTDISFEENSDTTYLTHPFRAEYEHNRIFFGNLMSRVDLVTPAGITIRPGDAIRGYPDDPIYEFPRIRTL